MLKLHHNLPNALCRLPNLYTKKASHSVCAKKLGENVDDIDPRKSLAKLWFEQKLLRLQFRNHLLGKNFMTGRLINHCWEKKLI